MIASITKQLLLLVAISIIFIFSFSHFAKRVTEQHNTQASNVPASERVVGYMSPTDDEVLKALTNRWNVFWFLLNFLFFGVIFTCVKNLSSKIWTLLE